MDKSSYLHGILTITYTESHYNSGKEKAEDKTKIRFGYNNERLPRLKLLDNYSSSVNLVSWH